MATTNLQINDVVQLSPESAYPGAFMVVTEPRDFGAQGFLCLPYEVPGIVRYKGVAYYRAKHEEMDYIGTAAFAKQDEAKDDHGC